MEKMNKEKEVYDKKINEYIDRITTPIFNKVLQEDKPNSMTTVKNTFSLLFRPNNYRRQIEIKQRPNSAENKILTTIGTIGNHNRIITVKNYKENITIQYGKNTLTAIYSCPRIYGKKQVYHIERDTINDINDRIGEIKKDIKKRLDNALKSFSLKFDLFLPFKSAIWSRHEDWVKGEEFIDNIPRETIIHDTFFKKVYGEGIEFIGGKEKEPTAYLKNYIKNRSIEDIAPIISNAITEVYDKFGSFISGMTPVLTQITNMNLEISKLRRDVTKIQRKRKQPQLNKDLRKWL